MEYLSDKEQQEMLKEFWEFDRRMIHLKYESVVEGLEGEEGRPLLREFHARHAAQ